MTEAQEHEAPPRSHIQNALLPLLSQFNAFLTTAAVVRQIKRLNTTFKRALDKPQNWTRMVANLVISYVDLEKIYQVCPYVRGLILQMTGTLSPIKPFQNLATLILRYNRFNHDNIGLNALPNLQVLMFDKCEFKTPEAARCLELGVSPHFKKLRFANCIFGIEDSGLLSTGKKAQKWLKEFRKLGPSLEEIEISATPQLESMINSLLKLFPNCHQVSAVASGHRPIDHSIAALPPDQLTHLIWNDYAARQPKFKDFVKLQSLIYLDCSYTFPMRSYSEDIQLIFNEMPNLRVIIDVQGRRLPHLNLKEKMFHDPVLELKRDQPLMYATFSDEQQNREALFCHREDISNIQLENKNEPEVISSLLEKMKQHPMLTYYSWHEYNDETSMKWAYQCFRNGHNLPFIVAKWILVRWIEAFRVQKLDLLKFEPQVPNPYCKKILKPEFYLHPPPECLPNSL